MRSIGLQEYRAFLKEVVNPSQPTFIGEGEGSGRLCPPNDGPLGCPTINIEGGECLGYESCSTELPFICQKQKQNIVQGEVFYCFVQKPSKIFQPVVSKAVLPMHT